jgi:hypothetical protein
MPQGLQGFVANIGQTSAVFDGKKGENVLFFGK